ncbi:hypothetical protein SBDP1_580065 [Syntrophobacter sp. SbD1]|nr:hypothetical protein SBDP1_580065 [Syntrophobacter sp. SbD1]
MTFPGIYQNLHIVNRWVARITGLVIRATRESSVIPDELFPPYRTTMF